MTVERNLYTLMGGKEHTGEIQERWMVAYWGIVAVNVDPENQDRIKVVIPSINESEICDKWVRPMIRFCGPKGFGDSHRQTVGTEVLLFGRGGQKHNLFYVPVYNEDYLVPVRLRARDVRGFHHDKDYLAITDRDFTVEGGRDVSVKAGRSLELEAGEVLSLKGSRVVLSSSTRVEIDAPEGLWVNGVRVNVP
jgi:Type VI secretion system/phage-baseplate injector OB domain